MSYRLQADETVAEGVQRIAQEEIEDAMAQLTALPHGHDAAIHDARKRGKYLWYHVRLLSGAWPGPLEALATALHRLSDYLGADHDLAELSRLLHEDPELSDRRQPREAILKMIDERQAELRSAADPLGRRIYWEKPSVFCARLSGYWETWRKTT